MGACFNIAIDGPAGAGKSTIAKQVAAQMGSVYVDTGAMYRAMALYLLEKGLDPKMAKEDPAGFVKQVETLCKEPQISIEYRDGVQVVLLNGENVNAKLRTQEVSDMASKSSGVGKLRKRLVELQQDLAKKTSVVMDGRDIGTVVLPDADVKVYLTADSRVRARRRYLENLEAKKKGRDLSLEDLDLDAIEKDVKERDERDMNRAESPLRQAEDAVLVDSSDMTIDQVVETILNLAAQKKGRPQVITARTAGFCFGVEKAVAAVYEEAAKGGDIVTFGPIIHNEAVVEDLKKKGVGVIETEEEIPAHADGTIVIRSHGVPRDLYEKLEASGARIVDTTCTFVKRIHEIVWKASREGRHIVIIGNHGHAETLGTMGWSGDAVTVIETREEAEAFSVDPATPITVVAQTTFHSDKFEELVAILRNKGYNTEVNNTICNATHERQLEARELAKRADVMIVIGGKGSSNTARLYEICKAECEQTCFVQKAEDLHLRLAGTEKLIGITAGASTPKNIIEEVQKDVRRTDF